MLVPGVKQVNVEEAAAAVPASATRGRPARMWSHTCSYLQQPQPLLIVESLHSCPEPANHYVVVMVTWMERGGGVGGGAMMHESVE